MKIGIIGNGFVGRATRIFVKNYYSENDNDERFEVLPDTVTTPAKENTGRTTLPFFKRIFFKPIEVYIYDIRPEACYPEGITLEILDGECDLLFFCLPTPLNHDGSCYTKILEDTLARCSNPYKIIRSTIPVGFAAKHGCYFMPEFLTEAQWENDFRSTKEWIVGIPTCSSAALTATNTDADKKYIAQITDIQRQEFKRRISKLIKRSHKNGSIDSRTIVFCDTNEAEMLKLMKNCFLSAKVSIMNEFHDFCHETKVDYNHVTTLAKQDKRMGTSHFQVPGPDGRRGFGGTCFPKDTHSLYYQMNEHGIEPYVFPAILKRNDTYDRPQREWAKDVWRTTIPLPSPESKVVVVFKDETSVHPSNSLYLNDIVHTNLTKNNIVIEIVRNENKHTKNEVEIPNHKIKYHGNPKLPLFFPRVDECYYIPHRNNTSYDTLCEVSGIIDLWNSHEEMILYVIKSGITSDYRIENDDYRNENRDYSESGTEGFDDDDDAADISPVYGDEPYCFDYAKIIQEYYHSKLSTSKRKLVILF